MRAWGRVERRGSARGVAELLASPWHHGRDERHFARGFANVPAPEVVP